MLEYSRYILKYNVKLFGTACLIFVFIEMPREFTFADVN